MMDLNLGDGLLVLNQVPFRARLSYMTSTATDITI